MLQAVKKASFKVATIARQSNHTLFNARRCLSSATLPLRVAIVGSGPSAFYVAKYLLDKAPSNTTIDIIEKLPTPFGLVRYGVAPDHPEVKSVIDQFNDIGSNPRVSYYGNVELGVNVQLQQLMDRYAAVVLATGAPSDRKLGIPGEEDAEVDYPSNDSGHSSSSSNNNNNPPTPGVKVISARAFVNWYNGHPHYQWVGPALNHLQGVSSVAIVGHGNVAIDCARILTESADVLHPTDILSEAVSNIQSSDIRSVHLIGRRGHAQAAFTIKELREISKLSECKLLIDPSEVEAGWTAESQTEVVGSRPKKRIVELINKIAAEYSKGGAGGVGNVEDTSDVKQKEIRLRFLLAPTAVVQPNNSSSSSSSSSDGACGGLLVTRTRLEGNANQQRAVPFVAEGQTTPTTELIPAQLVLRSVGYKGEHLTGLPEHTFDPIRGVIRNRAGRVVAKNDSNEGNKGSETVIPRLYVTGWCKRGPSGIIGTNIVDAKETVEGVLQDIDEGIVVTPQASTTSQAEAGAGAASLDSILSQKAHTVVDWAGHMRIDKEEVRRGQQQGKIRAKIVEIGELLRTAADDRDRDMESCA